MLNEPRRLRCTLKFENRAWMNQISSVQLVVRIILPKVRNGDAMLKDGMDVGQATRMTPTLSDYDNYHNGQHLFLVSQVALLNTLHA